jgi:regulation of enolase protein 1 (concanavalin A-like superfamily)
VWRQDDDTVIGTAGARTDLFINPFTDERTLNGPRLLAPAPAGDFQFSARVDVDFAATYDAGTLLVWAGEQTWAKLCFEYSPQGRPMAVSVVTRGVSDDANSFTVDGSVVWLRVSRCGGGYAFHASVDGTWWEFVRQFSLSDVQPDLGLGVQSPTGEGLTARFTTISLTPTTLADPRNGT